MKKLNYLIIIALMMTACEQGQMRKMEMQTEAASLDLQRSGDFIEEVTLDTKKEAAAVPVTQQTSEMKVQNNANTVAKNRKIIKTTSVNFEVKKLKESTANFKAMIKKYDAYVVSSNFSNDTYQLSNSMVIRVVPEDMDRLLADLLKEAVYISKEDTRARDVTEEFVDLKARLKSKRKVAEQYEALLKKAKNIEEILMIEDNLRVIREEIESKEGRLRYLNDQVAYSTIRMTCYESVPRVSVKGPRKSFLAKMGDGFAGGWQTVLTFIIAMTYIWPLLLVLVPVGILLVRKSKRSKKNK